MSDKSGQQVTLLLGEADKGNKEALRKLFPLVYEQLRELAAKKMAGERAGHTLQPTALVHEAYVRIMGERAGWTSSAHFYLAAAEAMRRILIDHARAHVSQKRGGGRQRLPLNSILDLTDGEHFLEILSLDDALLRLQELSASAAEVVRLRFYAGLSTANTAAALGVSTRSVQREWNFAKAWLARELEEEKK